MTDAHERAVQDAVDAYAEHVGERGWSGPGVVKAITAYLAAMRAEGWVMVRDVAEIPGAGPLLIADNTRIRMAMVSARASGWNACRAAMLKGATDGQG